MNGLTVCLGVFLVVWLVLTLIHTNPKALDAIIHFVEHNLIAEGYEDEDGFHYGKKPRRLP